MYSSKDFTSQELAGMPSKPHPITCLASAGILVYKYELVKGLSEKTTRESAELEGLFQLWKAYVGKRLADESAHGTMNSQRTRAWKISSSSFFGVEVSSLQGWIGHLTRWGRG